jgi:hypothetical protein
MSACVVLAGPALAHTEPETPAQPVVPAAQPETAEPDASDAIEAEPVEAEPVEPDAPDAIQPAAAPPVAAQPNAPEPAPTAQAPRPPRIDGAYIGATMFGGVSLVRVNDFDTDGPFATFGGTASVGQMVFPWLGLGLHGGGGGGVRSERGARQRLGQGFLGVQFKLVPLAKRHVPLSLLGSFGFGGGAVRQAGIFGRVGFGGAQFGAAVRYELFPWAKRRRPFRGGGFGLGPEIGWIGFTPAAADRPMSNAIYLALSTTFYFGS